MKTIYLAFALLLAGCVTAGQHFNQAQNYCSSNSLAPSYGICLEERLTEKYPLWRNDPHANYVTTYFSWLKAAGARVEKKEMPEDEFWKGSYELLHRMRTEAAHQSHANQAAQSSAMANFLTGLAIMNNGFVPAYQPQAIPQPLTPITCHQINNRVTRCY